MTIDELLEAERTTEGYIYLVKRIDRSMHLMNYPEFCSWELGNTLTYCLINRPKIIDKLKRLYHGDWQSAFLAAVVEYLDETPIRMSQEL